MGIPIFSLFLSNPGNRKLFYKAEVIGRVVPAAAVPLAVEPAAAPPHPDGAVLRPPEISIRTFFETTSKKVYDGRIRLETVGGFHHNKEALARGGHGQAHTGNPG